MDRAHVGEYVYGHMYRGNSETDSFMFDSEYLVNISDMYLILLTDHPKHVIAREDGQSLSTTEEKIAFERDRFIKGFSKSRVLNKLHNDWSDIKYFGKSFDESFDMFKKDVFKLLNIGV